MFVNAGAMMKINVIFHCVVLDAELEISVINEMDERLLKIRHVNFKSFFFLMFLRCFSFFFFLVCHCLQHLVPNLGTTLDVGQGDGLPCKREHPSSVPSVHV